MRVAAALIRTRLRYRIGGSPTNVVNVFANVERDIATRCADIHATIRSPHLRAAFDPANFIQCGVRPMDEAWPLLADVSTHIHIKDAVLADGHVVPAGEGDGQVEELLRALVQRGYRGYLTLEPHLQAAGPFGGFSGPDLFHTAVEALKRLLKAVEGGAA